MKRINEHDGSEAADAIEPAEAAGSNVVLVTPNGVPTVRRPPRHIHVGLMLIVLVAGWRMGLVNVIQVFAQGQQNYCRNLFEDWDDGEDDDDDDNCDPPSSNDGPEGGGSPCGMPVWRVSEPFINLWLHDTPLQYRLAGGRWMPLKLSYKQRSDIRDTNYAGFGPNWECNWITLLRVTNGVAKFSQRLPGGGAVQLDTYTPVYGSAKRGTMEGGGIYTTLDSPAGTKSKYGILDQYQGLAGVTNQFLSERQDRYGRSTRFNWISYTNGGQTYKLLSQVVDRDGRSSSLAYDNGSFPSLVTSVTDPYGRSATFTYNERGWLTNIVDMANMPSSFQYDTNGVITNLHTPYGDTSFRYWGSSASIDRAIEITEADSSQQLYAYRDNCLGAEGSVAGTYATTDTAAYNRNSFHWNRAQFAALSAQARTNYVDMPRADYFKGSLKHWLLKFAGGFQLNPVVSDTLGAMAGPVLQPAPSDVRSGQVYCEYQGQGADPRMIGTLKRVTKIVWNGTDYTPGTSTAIDIGRNDWGRPTNITYHYQGNDVAYANNFDTDGRILQTVIGPRGEAIRGYGYHAVITNLLTSVTNALSEVLRYTHDTNGMKVTSISYPSGLLTTNFYYTTGTTGFLSKTIDVGFRTNSYSYTSGNVAIHTNELGLITTNSWDNLNRLIATKYPDGSYTSNVWDKLDLVGVKDRMGFWTRYKFNLVRQLTAVTNANGAVTEYAYCGCGSPTQVKAWNGGTALTTTFDYNLAGQLTTATYPDNYQISYTYDDLERMLTALDSSGRQVAFGYNDYDQITAIQVGSGGNQLFWAVRTFDEYRRLTNNIDRNGVTTTNRYDVLDRMVNRRVIGALGNQLSGLESFEYNARGLTNATDALGKVTRFVRDQLSQPLYETNANSEVLGFTYNPFGQLLTLTDGKSQTTQWKYDSEGRVTNKVDAASAEMFRYKYDPNARLTNRWQAGGITTTFRYDPVGNLTNIVYPTASSIVLRYDLLNRLTNMTDGLGSTALAWTDGNQLASEDGPWASDTVSFVYSSRQRSSLAVQQPNATAWAQSYGYDTYRRLTNVTSPAGVFVTTYKAVSAAGVDMAADLVARLELPGGSAITNQLDDLGRLLATVLQNSSQSTLNSHGYVYNEGHQRTNQTFTAGNYVDYTYDNIGQLKTAKGKEAGGTTRLQEQFGYGYDAAWNLSKRTNNALIHTFNANNLNELTTVTRANNYTVAGAVSATPTSVTVKDNANSAVAATVYGDNAFARTNVTLLDGNNTFVAVAQDSLSRKDTNTVTAYLPATVTHYYDARGNLTNDGRRVFYYDDENQLTSVTVSNAWRSEFAYDGMLRRRIRKEYTWQSSAWVKTNEIRYVYDGRLVVQERDANNLALVSYTRGNDLSETLQDAGGIGGLLARTDNGQLIAGSPLAHAYYHADGNGNITALVNTNQLLAAKYAYDPYGNLLSMAGPMAEANTYRFSSKEFHPNSGLVYYLYRYYEPNLQRWLNRDPIAENGGLNLFAFIGNMPTGAIDPYGLDWKDKCASIFAAAVAWWNTITGDTPEKIDQPKPPNIERQKQQDNANKAPKPQQPKSPGGPEPPKPKLPEPLKFPETPKGPPPLEGPVPKIPWYRQGLPDWLKQPPPFRMPFFFMPPQWDPDFGKDPATGCMA